MNCVYTDLNTFLNIHTYQTMFCRPLVCRTGQAGRVVNAKLVKKTIRDGAPVR